MTAEVARYNSVAISLHGLIAILLTGMLATGKYMTSLDETDHLRYSLTQWHKSFGITLLFLVLIRVLWRLLHKPPVLPSSVTVFERLGSHATHVLMYVLMVVLPLSGWVMVSASPLNLSTVLFGIMPWPHFPLADKSSLAEPTAMAHIWLANTLLLLILMHVGAAFFHQLVRKDHLISRMIISSSHRKANDLNHGLVFGFCLGLAGMGFLASQLSPVSVGAIENSVAQVESKVDSQVESKVDSQVDSNVNTLAATVVSTVEFQVLQNGSPLDGHFSSTDIALSVDINNPSQASLVATVLTASVSTGDSQLDATVVTTDWFASDDHPEATFASSSFESAGANAFVVRGVLTIKDIAKDIEFDLILEDTLDDQVGRGQFVINRSDFGVGDDGQDEFVDTDVTIRFEASNSEDGS